MITLDLGVYLDRVSDDPRAFRHFMMKVGNLKVLEFNKFSLK